MYTYVYMRIFVTFREKVSVFVYENIHIKRNTSKFLFGPNLAEPDIYSNFKNIYSCLLLKCICGNLNQYVSNLYFTKRLISRLSVQTIKTFYVFLRVNITHVTSPLLPTYTSELRITLD